MGRTIRVTCDRCGEYAFDMERTAEGRWRTVYEPETGEACQCRPRTGIMRLWQDTCQPGGLISWLAALDPTPHSTVYATTSTLAALHEFAEANGLYGVTIIPPAPYNQE